MKLLQERFCTCTYTDYHDNFLQLYNKCHKTK